jgi:DNA modification methylase
LIGDVREMLRTLPAEHFHCAVTSPPYWQLRCYGVEGQIGQEATPELFIETLVDVFRELGRVLRSDGVLYVNIGDTYNAGGRIGNGTREGYKQSTSAGSMSTGDKRANAPGLADGQRLLMPHRFAIAMQQAGWILRQEIIWSKRSPMPESINGWQWKKCRVKVAGTGWQPGESPEHSRHEKSDQLALADGSGGTVYKKAQWQPCPGCAKCTPNGGYVLRKGSWRPTTAHEPIYMFVKSGEYFGDGDGSAEATSRESKTRPQGQRPKHESAVSSKENAMAKGRSSNGDFNGYQPETRNMRSVWTLSTEQNKEKHFAAYPSELVRRCIVAATSPAGCCPACGSQYAPIVHKERVATRPGNDSKVGRVSQHEESSYHAHTGTIVGNRDPQRHQAINKIEGYRATCKCKAGEPVPARVLEPFNGTGTTPQTASWYGRECTAIELNPAYAEISERRVKTKPVCLLRTEKPKKKPRATSPDQQTLF